MRNVDDKRKREKQRHDCVSSPSEVNVADFGGISDHEVAIESDTNYHPDTRNHEEKHHRESEPCEERRVRFVVHQFRMGGWQCVGDKKEDTFVKKVGINILVDLKFR